MDALVPMCERRKWRLRIAGDNWQLSPLNEPYGCEKIPAGAPLARFFQTSKVNLQINGDTNFHPRVLECLAAGGFVLSERHVTDAHPGGLRSALPAEVAPTWESFEELETALAFWIEHDEARKAAAAEGARQCVALSLPVRNQYAVSSRQALTPSSATRPLSPSQATPGSAVFPPPVKPHG